MWDMNKFKNIWEILSQQRQCILKKNGTLSSEFWRNGTYKCEGTENKNKKQRQHHAMNL